MCTKQNHGPLNPILTLLSHAPSVLSLFFSPCIPVLTPFLLLLSFLFLLYLLATPLPASLLLLLLCFFISAPFSFSSCYLVVIHSISCAPSFPFTSTKPSSFHLLKCHPLPPALSDSPSYFFSHLPYDCSSSLPLKLYPVSLY